MALVCKANPFSQVAYSVAKNVRKNKGTFVFKRTVSSPYTRVVSEYEFKRDVFLLDPSPVSEWLVSQGVRTDGDIKVHIPSLCLEKALAEDSDDDPEVYVDGVLKELSDLRLFNTLTGGIDVRVDKMVFNGETYRIIQVQPEELWFNVPAKFKVILRASGD